MLETTVVNTNSVKEQLSFLLVWKMTSSFSLFYQSSHSIYHSGELYGEHCMQNPRVNNTMKETRVISYIQPMNPPAF